MLYSASVKKAGMIINFELPKATISEKITCTVIILGSQNILKRLVRSCMGTLLKFVEENRVPQRLEQICQRLRVSSAYYLTWTLSGAASNFVKLGKPLLATAC